MSVSKSCIIGGFTIADGTRMTIRPIASEGEIRACLARPEAMSFQPYLANPARQPPGLPIRRDIAARSSE